MRRKLTSSLTSLLWEWATTWVAPTSRQGTRLYPKSQTITRALIPITKVFPSSYDKECRWEEICEGNGKRQELKQFLEHGQIKDWTRSSLSGLCLLNLSLDPQRQEASRLWQRLPELQVLATWLPSHTLKQRLLLLEEVRQKNQTQRSSFRSKKETLFRSGQQRQR